jgi:hypothetical protein
MQSCWLGKQATAQTPIWHTPEGPQSVPQAPQFRGSSSTLTHFPSQRASPVAHAVTQLPLVQDSPVLQLAPQPPQLKRSFETSTQAFPH